MNQTPIPIPAAQVAMASPRTRLGTPARIALLLAALLLRASAETCERAELDGGVDGLRPPCREGQAGSPRWPGWQDHQAARTALSHQLYLP
jgi:hypothetical protein